LGVFKHKSKLLNKSKAAGVLIGLALHALKHERIVLPRSHTRSPLIFTVPNVISTRNH